MRRLIQRVALWVLSVVAPDARYLVVPNDELLASAKLLTDAQERWVDRSGEAKNHQVRAALMKRHPTATQRQISLAIEAALGD